LIDLSIKLAELVQQGLYRSRRIIDSPQGVELVIDGKKVVNFCSNDYLGLANHPAIARAFKQATDAYGVGSGAAHLICGHSREHHALEEELAAFTGRDRALLFSTGYMANLGVIAALLGRGDVVLEDRLNHASLVDGGLLSGAKLKRYAHADCGHLAKLLNGQTKDSLLNNPPLFASDEAPVDQGKQLIVTDGVFSMDGDTAPLHELVAVTKAHDAWLMVDDAHGFGVLGEKGGGLLQACGINQDQVQIVVGTLGKAFGTFGAFVAGSEDLIEFLIQKSRTYVYTTAMPPAVAAATRASLQIVQQECWRRDKLNQLIARFQTGAAQLGLPLMASQTPIQPVLVGDADTAMQISQGLLDKGLLISAIRPPTVPKGSARLRITFSASHEEAQVDRLLDALGRELS
jgi:8-amino-7-oxononanoate synthase